MSRSPDGPVHHKVDRGASWELADRALLHGCVNFDLPHVRVSPVLVVGQHGDLDHECADGLVCALKNTHTHTHSDRASSHFFKDTYNLLILTTTLTCCAVLFKFDVSVLGAPIEKNVLLK